MVVGSGPWMQTISQSSAHLRPSIVWPFTFFDLCKRLQAEKSGKRKSAVYIWKSSLSNKYHLVLTLIFTQQRALAPKQILVRGLILTDFISMGQMIVCALLATVGSVDNWFSAGCHRPSFIYILERILQGRMKVLGVKRDCIQIVFASSQQGTVE